MKITLTKNQQAAGLYIARCGKARVTIVMPNISVRLGLAPTDSDVRQYLRDCSSPSDKPIPHDAIVFRK